MLQGVVMIKMCSVNKDMVTIELKVALSGSMLDAEDISKTCSHCGYLLACLPLSTRTWTCPGCACVHDRDLNAAINLMNLAVSSTVSACGEEGSGLGRGPKAKPASAKQEFSCKAGND